MASGPVATTPALADELEAHRERQGAFGFDRIASDALVFQTATGLSPGGRNVHRAISRAAIRAGLSPVDAKGSDIIGPHDLRHSKAGVARELANVADSDVTRLMRHANEYVTKVMYGGRPGTQERKRLPSEASSKRGSVRRPSDLSR